MNNRTLRLALCAFAIPLAHMLPLAQLQPQPNTEAFAWAPLASISRLLANPEYPPSGKYAHERLQHIRAIVLDNGVARAALIGADQSGLSEQVWSVASKEIAGELKCPPNRSMPATTRLS